QGRPKISKHNVNVGFSTACQDCGKDFVPLRAMQSVRVQRFQMFAIFSEGTELWITLGLCECDYLRSINVESLGEIVFDSIGIQIQDVGQISVCEPDLEVLFLTEFRGRNVSFNRCQLANRRFGPLTRS